MSKQLTAGLLFSGGGGFSLGLKAAGAAVSWGVEYDESIAAVARANGLATLTADILKCVPGDFSPVDILQASPPCPNFSTAKTGGVESDNDLNLARKVAAFVTFLRPSAFILENVYGYRKSQSWGIIAAALHDAGYSADYWHLNAANYGVPQTRMRMIVIAYKDGRKPTPPPATHARAPVNGLFGRLDKWVSWHDAIADLIPALPDSEFAPWQLERLPAELTANSRAFIVNGTPNDNGRSITAVTGNNPAFAQTATQGRRPPRAFIMGTNANDTSGAPVFHDENEPVKILRAATGGRVLRAHVSGRVVKMSPRALARFQSFPDSYRLPEKSSLAIKIIGNAVPPLMARRISEHVIRGIE